MRRLASTLTIALIAVLALASVALTAPSNSDELLSKEKHFLQQLKTPFKGGNKGGSALNMVAVGHNDIGGRGFNADVWTHEQFAYVGHWGFTDWSPGGEQRFCPEGANAGVAVLDTRNPSNPVDIGRLQNPSGTSAEDVVVYTAQFGPYATRDIAAAGIQVCGGSRYDTSFFRGIMLWDVTNPFNPVPLGRFNTGCCTRGLHEFEIQHRPDLGRTFAYVTVPLSEFPDSASPSGVRDQQGRGDFRLIDITDPTQPVEVSNWGVVRNLGGAPSPGLGCDPLSFGHGAEPSDDGRLVFVSYWDSGFIALDVTNPADPVFRGRTVYPAIADGDGHSSSFDDARGLLFTADEDFCKSSGAGIEKGFGYLRVYDYSNLGAPVQIGEYRTPNASGTTDVAAGDYTIHNPLVVGTDVYISWYSDGIRVVDASNPRSPREVAFFVPPAVKNPVKPSQRGVLSNTTQVWGVGYDHDTGLVYASDMNSGLWILRRTG